MQKLREILCKNWQPQSKGQLQTASIRLVLKEMQAYLQEISHSADVLDSKIQSFSQLSGWIAFAVSLFLQSSLVSSPLTLWITAAIAAYGVIAFVVLSGQQPRVYRSPITLEWEELDDIFFRESEQSAMLVLISDYIVTIQENKRVLAAKAKLYQWMLRVLGGLLGAILLITLCLVFTGGK